MAELFIELFSEEIPSKLQVDARKKIIETKLIKTNNSRYKALPCIQKLYNYFNM